MARFNPFPKVSGRYGASMGRYAGVIDQQAKTLCAMHQGGGDGYDKGGAYWGFPSSVWAVWSYGKGEDGVVYVRANSRQDAINKAREL